MRKKLIITTLLASLFLLNGIFLSEAQAVSEDKLTNIQSDRQAVQQDLSNQEKELTKLLTEIKEMNEKVGILNNEVEGKQAELTTIKNEIDGTLAEVANLQEEIERLDEKIEQRFDILKSRAVSYQKTGGSINYLEVLFGSTSFSDFISRLGAVTQIVDADAALMEELNEDLATVEKHQQTTMEKLDELNTMHAAEEELINALATEQAQLEVAKADLENQQQSLASYINQLEDEDAALASLESEVKNEIALAIKKQQEAEDEAKRIKAEQERAAAKANKPANTKQTQASESTKTVTKEQATTSTENSSASSAGKSSNKKSFTVSSTAYTANCKGCSGITSTGINLKKNPNSKVIAVDPSVIPLGSTVYVEGYGYAIAGDTGGSIRGNKIDVFFPNKSQAMSWGRKSVKVTVQ